MSDSDKAKENFPQQIEVKKLLMVFTDITNPDVM